MVNTISKDQRGMSGPVWLGVLLAVALIVAATLTAWYLQQRTIDDLNDQIDQLQTQIDAQADEDEQAAPEQAGITYTSENGVEVIVDAPVADSTVSSPLQVSGQVPGNWSFEADFPIELQTQDGTVVAQAAGQLQGDWMTEELVEFTATLEFEDVDATSGALVLMKANPSGLPENDDSVTIQVEIAP